MDSTELRHSFFNNSNTVIPNYDNNMGYVYSTKEYYHADDNNCDNVSRYTHFPDTLHFKDCHHNTTNPIMEVLS